MHKTVNDWLEKNCIEKLILENVERFEKTTKIVKGAIVYKEIRTDHYWYLDTFHKNHYEVFDRHKNHIGEANLDGNLNNTKSDSSKNGKIEI